MSKLVSWFCREFFFLHFLTKIKWWEKKGNRCLLAPRPSPMAKKKTVVKMSINLPFLLQACVSTEGPLKETQNLFVEVRPRKCWYFSSLEKVGYLCDTPPLCTISLLLYKKKLSWSTFPSPPPHHGNPKKVNGYCFDKPDQIDLKSSTGKSGAVLRFGVTGPKIK